MTRAEKKKELVKLFLMKGVSLSEVIDEAMNFEVNKACEWLEENPPIRFDDVLNYVEQFKQAMEQ